MFQRVVSGTLDQAVQAGVCSATTLATWWRTLQEAEGAGHFLAGFPGFLVSGCNVVLADCASADYLVR